MKRLMVLCHTCISKFLIQLLLLFFSFFFLGNRPTKRMSGPSNGCLNGKVTSKLIMQRQILLKVPMIYAFTLDPGVKESF